MYGQIAFSSTSSHVAYSVDAYHVGVFRLRGQEPAPRLARAMWGGVAFKMLDSRTIDPDLQSKIKIDHLERSVRCLPS